MRVRKKIGIIGAGIFGSTCAIHLAKAGYDVTIFEKNEDILMAASSINQYRIHQGYHYPRSLDTIKSCKESRVLFENFYDDAILRDNSHYYALSADDSFVNKEEYLSVFTENGLDFEIVNPNHIDKSKTQVIVKVNENLFDPLEIKEIIKKRFAEFEVNLKLNTEVKVEDLSHYDFVVVTAYSNLNSALGEKEEFKRNYQFEVCEKIVIDVPDELKKVSTVVMDGPFMSLDPYGRTGHSVMGHVVHAIHSSNIGQYPIVPDNLKPLLNKGVIKESQITNHQAILEHGSQYIPSLKKAKYIGSMYTVRTVLAKVEDTDARPTLVTQLDEKTIMVYSGKIGNSVKAAEEVLSLITR